MNDHWHEAKSNSMNVVRFGMEKGHLRVLFRGKDGETRLYQYATEDKSLCCRWEMATSVGTFFHQYVRDLPYARIR